MNLELEIILLILLIIIIIIYLIKSQNNKNTSDEFLLRLNENQRSDIQTITKEESENSGNIYGNRSIGKVWEKFWTF